MGYPNRFIFKKHVALISVSGAIMDVSDTLQLLKKLEKNHEVVAGIVTINSPGGTAAGSEQLYHGLRSLAAKKPVVAVIETLAASGGYIAALGADYIVAQETSLVGSIGVLFQTPHVEEALKKLGMSVDSVRSTPLKATPSMVQKNPPETERMLEGLVADIYGWFKGLVVERRELSPSQLSVAANGAIFTGRQALDLKLVDILGDQRRAREWLDHTHKIKQNIPVQSYVVQRRGSWGVLGTMLQWLGVLTGANGSNTEFLGMHINDGLSAEGLMGSGMLALWSGHPSQSQ
jgi:protease-4